MNRFSDRRLTAIKGGRTGDGIPDGDPRLAEYYANQSPSPGKAGNPKLIEMGRKIFEEGVPARGVRACASCHGDHAQGASVFPRLAGQHADYVLRQLKGFGSRLRPHGILMRNETAHMSELEMRAVTEYVQSL
jgi:cytochrome c553